MQSRVKKENNEHIKISDINLEECRDINEVNFDGNFNFISHDDIINTNKFVSLSNSNKHKQELAMHRGQSLVMSQEKSNQLREAIVNLYLQVKVRTAK